mmetsp:Transcript_45374/g.117433  ORF Transcript_45374/g.117433 Transcript_45374/m.117433 type:complete len:162 (-) Transcript_45374:63-548(-)
MRALLLLLAACCFWAAEAAGDKKARGQGPSASACSTCQSVAHLLVKARKEMASDKEKSNSEIVGSLFTDRDTKLCTEEKLQSYADYLKIKAPSMVKKCKSMVPEKFEYKSAQDLRKALLEGRPRTAVAKLLCVESGRCDQLWTKEEEPWQNWKKAAEKSEM